MIVHFSKMAIECLITRERKDSLKKRQNLKIDPFCQGFDYIEDESYLKKLDMNSVRLCFQVFVPIGQNESGMEEYSKHVTVSEVIKDKRVYEDLQIVSISDDCAPIDGGKKIIMLTTRIAMGNVQVLFEYNIGSI